MSNDTKPPYRIVEVAMPEGRVAYFITQKSKAPFLDAETISPFISIEEIIEWWPRLKEIDRSAPLITEPIKSQHHLDREYFWRRQASEMAVLFHLPVDEFTERLELGEANGPEALSLQEELVFDMQAAPHGLWLEAKEVRADKLWIMAHRDGLDGKAPFVQISLPVKITINWPGQFVNDHVMYLRKYITSTLKIDFLGIDALEGTLYFAE